MKYDEALILVERITKAQQEAGQREMMNRNTVFTRLKEYLDNKWNDKDSPLNKHQLKQKLNEYKRFEEIKRFGKNYSKKFVYFNKNPESDEGKKEKKSDINTRKFIKQTLDKKSEWLIKNGSNEINYDISNDMPIVMRSKNNKRTEEYNLTNQKDFDTYEKLVAEHEYGHLYNWLKHYIETGKKEELPPTFTKKDRRIGSDEEGRAEEYAFNNVYRKDRRDILKNSNLYFSRS